ncbi:helix-turn-helix transcriptional regulator [Vibrio parahaemolyticus]|uniref:helix-turn-helix transcriptional regulator n=1 Tax=Vibrio parahaemolyticus TaxID=670 RepID=UPI0009A4F8C5|nr:response regulator transcription factor [Vibrio parahaemolyticus]ELN6894058.1 response regulator transcription factor [Vibrio cholerae]EKC5524113.1 response regulator transcription factor [Vibrio parahaemolyticus]MBM4959684.1 response regulator transcription factor [Vibrio parahaemolyticus]MBM5096301.1 response regulator transcription factor [Vibrio parahaemolyticus]
MPRSTCNNLHYTFPELTFRQYSILQAYSLGVTQKQIAVVHNITDSTVKEHLQAIRTKLGCHSTSDLRYIFLTRLLSECCYHFSHEK